jgi:Ser/Thr protein kinase RdoA (MazF antagonist)
MVMQNTAATAPLGALLDTAPPPVTPAQAQEIAFDLYGVTATATPLTGERDHNFHLLGANGQAYVLKVIHPAEDPGVTDFQSQALLHALAADPGLPIPHVQRPLTGGGDAVWAPPGQAPRRIRLLTYLDGRPLHLLTPTTALRRHLGACLARLDLALETFTHASDRHDLLWNVQHAGQVRFLLDALPASRRALPLRVLDRFEAHAVPHLPGLRHQVVHNDFNPHNILADARSDDRIAGIIDFGDMVRAPMIQDIATAAAYQILPTGPVLQGPAEMIAAFHQANPLLPEELDVLPEMIATRLVLTIAISSWRASRHPDNAAYIMRNQPNAWAGLQRFDELGRAEAFGILQQACAQEVTR